MKSRAKGKFQMTGVPLTFISAILLRVFHESRLLGLQKLTDKHRSISSCSTGIISLGSLWNFYLIVIFKQDLLSRKARPQITVGS